MSSVKICTWNVNGIRSRKNLKEVFREVDADIFCIQETKIPKEQIEEDLAFVNNDYLSCFAIPKQNGFKGRSGCATYYKDSARPYHAEYGLFDEQTCSDDWRDHIESITGKFATLDEVKELDSEGRLVVTCHHIIINKKEEKNTPNEAFVDETKSGEDTSTNQESITDDEARKLYLFNVYFPRLDPDKEGRAEFKDKFNRLIQQKAENFLKDPKSHVIIACDLNIQHKQIDSCEYEEDFDKCVYRVWLTELLKPDSSGVKRHLVDTFRKLYPDKKYAYTCWPTQVVGSWEANYGTRIDYLLVDSELARHTKDVVQFTKIRGSDHCPVLIEFNDLSLIASKDQPYGCTRTWPKFQKRQTTIKSFFSVRQRSSPSEKNQSTNNSSENSKSTKDGSTVSAKKLKLFSGLSTCDSEIKKGIPERITKTIDEKISSWALSQPTSRTTILNPPPIKQRQPSQPTSRRRASRQPASKNSIVSQPTTKIRVSSQPTSKTRPTSQPVSSKKVVDKSNSNSPSIPNRPLTGYEKIMQRKTKPAKPKPSHCPEHGFICEPKLNEKKDSANYNRYYYGCPDPTCKFFRWAK